MIPFASSENVRLVLLNARDNGQSTLYTEAELASIHSTDFSTQEAFMQESIREFAAFLAWFVQQEDRLKCFAYWRPSGLQKRPGS